MTQKALTPKALDTLVDKIASRYMAGVQVPILELSTISKAGKDAYLSTHDMIEVEKAIAIAIESVRVN